MVKFTLSSSCQEYEYLKSIWKLSENEYPIRLIDKLIASFYNSQFIAKENMSTVARQQICVCLLAEIALICARNY